MNHRAQIGPHHLLDERDQQNQPRPLDAGEAAQREHHAALIFAQDLDRGREEDQSDQDDGRVKGEVQPHSGLLCR
jgi:hypothetical protein